jgi:hypothetical protein
VLRQGRVARAFVAVGTLSVVLLYVAPFARALLSHPPARIHALQQVVAPTLQFPTLRIALLRLEASLTGDLILTTSYAPRFKQALLPLAPAGTALAKELRTAKGWTAQADVFARYRVARAGRGDTRHAAGAAGALTDAERRAGGAPASRRAQRRSRERAQEEGRERSERGDPLAVCDRLRRRAKTRNAEIVAARAYNARIAISVLTAAIAKERQQLIKSIG